MAEKPETGAIDVATKVFEDFVGELTVSGVPAEIVTNLRKALLEDHQFTERALKAAIFPNDTPP